MLYLQLGLNSQEVKNICPFSCLSMLDHFAKKLAILDGVKPFDYVYDAWPTV